ncbi:nitrate ABC transporter, permease protein, partial [Acinetobacter baumannii]
FASAVLPPLIMLALIMLVWEILCSGRGATLPPPSQVWREASDLILDPFFVNGSQDIGLGWRVLTSLQRVAIGFGLSAVVGI